MRPCFKTILSLAGFLTISAQAAVVGEVIAARQYRAAAFAVMSAVDGSQYAEVDCGGDLTHTGSPRYFVYALSGAVSQPDGYLNSEIAAADEDCALTVIIASHEDMRFDTVPHWSPDGARIAVYGQRFVPWDATPVESGIYLLDVVRSADGRPVDTANLRLAVALPGHAWLGWSGDGGRLVYSQSVPNADGQKFLDIFVHDLASGVSLNVTNTPDESEVAPVFSPVDDRIAFSKVVSARGTNRQDIFTMNAAGGSLTQVTNKKTIGSGSNISPEFSPDGQYLLFSSGGVPNFTAGYDLLKIKSDGRGKAVNLTSTLDGDYRWHFWRR